MADTERDRFGEKLRDKQKGHEDTYFSRRDRELLEKMREERRRQAAAGPMECPRCQTGLVERIQHDVTVDECPNCGGIWFDKGEFEHIARSEQEGWFGRLLRERLGGA